MNKFQVISPIDGQIITEKAYATDAEIEKVMTRSQSARAIWSRTSISERAHYCDKVIEYFQANSAEMSKEITLQMGRPIQYAPLEVKGGFVERAEHMIKMASSALEDIRIPEKEGFRRFIRKEPLGTVLVLAPWNYPYLTSVNAIIPALMAGNTVILKHSEQTALCSERYRKAFEFAGVPEGVFEVLHVDHDQVAGVIQDSRISYVAFTGSVEGGHAIRKAISARFIGAGLELGGKDPAYVAQDVHVVSAVENLVDGSFFNSGQSCCGIERIYVHASVYDEFVHAFLDLTKQYKIGNPLHKATTLGPLVRSSNAQSVQEQVDRAIKQGAKPLISETDFDQVDLPYLNPQVLTHVTHEMEVMREETFGPVVGIMKVKGDEEAITWMNDSQYGLTASIWTNDQERALRIGNQVETGTWFMNRCDYLDPELAWTGVKNSGFGCTLSALGYDYLTRPKSYHLKVKP